MKVTVKTKELVAALNRVAAVTQNNIVTLQASDKGFIRVAAQGKTNLLAIKVKAKVDKAGAVSLENVMFATAIKSRAEVNLQEKDSKLVVTGKSLTTKLVTTPVEEVPSISKKEGSTMDAELQEAFSRLVSRTAITNVHDKNPIGYRVSIGKKGMTVTAADAHHMASATMASAKSKTPLKFTMAGGAFATIASLAGKEPYNLHFTDSELLVWSKEFELRIPTLADEGNGPSEEAVNSMVEKLQENKSVMKATVECGAFYNVLDTLEAIFEAGANVHVSASGDKMIVKFITSYGESEGEVDCKLKGKLKCQVDLPLTKDAFANVQGKSMTIQQLGESALYVLEADDEISSTYLLTMVTK